MRFQVALFYNGFVLALTGLFMLISAIVGIYYNDGSASTLAVAGFITMGFGAFPTIFIQRSNDISLRESIFVVGFGWITCTLAGALPFYLYGQPFSFINSIFESISGFTTTGASILSSVEDIPKGILFWRACTEWLGGIGIISFALAVIPRMGQVSRSFLQQEYTGLVVRPAFARAKDIVRGLFAVYLGLTIAQTIALMLTGMPGFDAVTNALATLPTGGFSVRNNSMAYYGSISAEIITMIFMLIGGMNFVFLHMLLTRPGKLNQGKSTAYIYLITILLTALVVSIMIYGKSYPSFAQALRFGAFQVISVATTTGFASANSAVWPISAQFTILMITIIGACNGSTGGGIKYDRILNLFKLLRFRIGQMLHPNLVPSIRIDNKFISFDDIEKSVFYIIPFLGLLGIATVILSVIGMDAMDSFSGTVACLANAGPGMGSVGSMGNYSEVPGLGKAILSFVMLAGRLEIFALVLPFTPGFWKN